MSILFAMLASFSQQSATDETLVHPDPRIYLDFSTHGFGFFGYGQCLSDRGHIHIQTTRLPVEEVLERTVADCRIVYDAAYSEMTARSSPFREIFAERLEVSVSSPKVEQGIASLLDGFTSLWVEKLRPQYGEFRKSEEYNPDKALAEYNEAVESGELDWDGVVAQPKPPLAPPALRVPPAPSKND